jgi:hypothetical protein
MVCASFFTYVFVSVIIDQNSIPVKMAYTYSKINSSHMVPVKYHLDFTKLFLLPICLLLQCSVNKGIKLFNRKCNSYNE